MAIIDVPETAIPAVITSTSTLPNIGNSSTLSSAGHKNAAVLPIRKTGTISKIYVRSGSTGNAGNAYTFSIQTISAGYPSGTLWAANTQQTGVTGIVGGGGIYSATLDAGASVNAGDIIGVVIECTTYVGNATFGIGFADGTGGGIGLPYLANFTTSWTTLANSPNLIIEYDDGTFYEALNVYSFTDITSVGITNASNPRLVGNKITPTKTMRVIGFYIWCDLDETLDVIIYDTDGSTVLTSASVDKDLPGGSVNIFVYTGYFSTPAILQENSSYYIVYKNNTATTINTYDFSALNSTARQYFNGGSVLSRVTTTVSTPVDTSSYTEDDTKMTALGIIVDGIDSGTTGGETAHTFC